MKVRLKEEVGENTMVLLYGFESHGYVRGSERLYCNLLPDDLAIRRAHLRVIHSDGYGFF